MTESALPKQDYTQTHGIAFGDILNDLHVFKALGGKFDTFTPPTEPLGKKHNCYAYALNIKEVTGDSVLSPGDFLDLKPVNNNSQHGKSYPEWCENGFDDRFKWDGFKRTLSASDVAIKEKLATTFDENLLNYFFASNICSLDDLLVYKKWAGEHYKDITYIRSLSYTTHQGSLQDPEKVPNIVTNVIGENTPMLLLQKEGYYMCLKVHPNQETDVGFDFSTVLGCDDNPWACTGGKVQKLSLEDVQLLATQNGKEIYMPELLYAPQHYNNSMITKTKNGLGTLGDYTLNIVSPNPLFSADQMAKHAQEQFFFNSLSQLKKIIPTPQSPI